LAKKELCRNCPLWENAKSNCIPGRGSNSPQVIFVGEAPGSEEDKFGKVFIGDAGKLLDEFIYKYKFHYDDYFITNVCRCRPDRNRTPTRTEIRACSSYLFDEIQRLKPKIIVPMGNTALRAILGETGIHSYRNRVLRSDTYNCDVLPMLHPAAITRNPEHKFLMDKDFQKLKAYLAEHITAESRERVEFGEVKVVQTKLHMKSVYKKILKRGIMFWDVETNGEDVYNKDLLEITSASIACENRVAYVFPVTEYSTDLYQYFIEEFMRSLLENPKIKKCAQNMNFDAKVMKVKYGIETNNWWFDTMIAHYLIRPVRGTHNLHAMTWEYLSEEAGGYDDFVKSVGGAHKIEPGPDLWYYNGLDSSVGFELMTIFEPLLKNRGHWQIFREVMMEVSDDLMDMEIRGMQFDVPYIRELSLDYQAQMYELEKLMGEDEGIVKFEWRYGKRFNPRSHVDLSWLLFEHYALPIIKTSKKTKKPSTDKECIAMYAQDGNTFCQHLQTYRRLAKADSTYLSGLAEKLYEGGISHTNFNITITATGRTSSGANPELKAIRDRAFNMQNIPRDPDIKRIMMAREGHVLIAGDLSQIELRILACLANDEALVEAVSKDAHRGMAAAVFEKNFEDITHEERQVGKMLNFAIVYEVSAEGLAPRLTAETDTHWSVPDAGNLIDTLKSRFPSLAKWKDFVRWHVQKYGFISTPLGRRRYFQKKDDREMREAVNMPIQSLASDFMLISIIKINRRLKHENVNAWLVNEIHDSVIAECVDDRNVILKVAYILKEEMEEMYWPVSGNKFDWLTIPVKADIEIGYNMGHMTPLKKWGEDFA
jgi:DNA polymerase-1